MAIVCWLRTIFGTYIAVELRCTSLFNLDFYRFIVNSLHAHGAPVAVIKNPRVVAPRPQKLGQGDPDDFSLWALTRCKDSIFNHLDIVLLAVYTVLTSKNFPPFCFSSLRMDAKDLTPMKLKYYQDSLSSLPAGAFLNSAIS